MQACTKAISQLKHTIASRSPCCVLLALSNKNSSTDKLSRAINYTIADWEALIWKNGSNDLMSRSVSSGFFKRPGNDKTLMIVYWKVMMTVFLSFLSFSSFRSFIWSETHALSSHQSKIRSKFAFCLLIVISVENHLTPLGCNLVTFHAERNRSLYERGRRLQNVGLDFFSKVTWPSLC